MYVPSLECVYMCIRMPKHSKRLLEAQKGAAWTQSMLLAGGQRRVCDCSPMYADMCVPHVCVYLFHPLILARRAGLQKLWVQTLRAHAPQELQVGVRCSDGMCVCVCVCVRICICMYVCIYIYIYIYIYND